jgi:hypothetical protein
MKRKLDREFKKGRAVRRVEILDRHENSAGAQSWPGEHSRHLAVIGIALIVLCTVIIYRQTVQVPPLNYEDAFYPVHSPYVCVNVSFSGVSRVWNEPYFANFHPVTTCRSPKLDRPNHIDFSIA